MLSFAALAASLLLLQGCATSRPGTIVGDTIVNPTVAFTGYRAHIPPGYAEISTADMSGVTAAERAEILEKFDMKAIGRSNVEVVDSFSFYSREKKAFLLFGAAELCIPGITFSSLPDNQRKAALDMFQRGSVPGIRGTWRRIPSPGTGSILLTGDTKIGSARHGVALSITLGKTSEIFIIAGVSANSDPTAISQDVAAMTSGITLK